MVSAHGNAETDGYTRIETETMSGVDCNNCHEAHGNNENANNKRNLRMIREAVIVTGSTTESVVFETTTGVDSLGGDGVDDLCEVCHSSLNNPGWPMARHEDGNHDSADTSSIFEGEDFGIYSKQGDDCTICHRHEYKPGAGGATTSADGFMAGC